MSPDENKPAARALSFEDFFLAVPCYLSVQGPDLRILATNDYFLDQFGPATGEYCYKVYKHCSSECEDCPARMTFRDGKTHISEQVIALADGRRIPTITFTSPVLGPDQEVLAVTQISADITLVKRLESQLRDSRKRLRALFDEVPCYISVQDRDLCIVESNRRFKEDFGDFEGAHCYEVYKHRNQQCLHCPVAATFHDGKTHFSEEVVTSLSGEQINTLVFTAPILDEEGKIETVMEMSTNITEIRKLQGRLTNLGMYVGSLSHGLKGMLMSLDGGMYMLKTGLAKNKPDRIHEGWEMVERNVEHIRRVVMDLLYIAGESETQFEAVPLQAMAETVVQKMTRRAEDLQIDFQVNLDCGQETCELDQSALAGCMTNILENAFEACRLDSHKNDHFVR
ncbi:MAG: PAS domain-containing protein, partial [Planctomycetota bacterium]